MNILNTIYYTIVRNLRDKKSMALMLLMPIVSIFIIGTALSSTYTPKSIDELSVCYINEDSGEIGRGFDQFINSKEIKEIMDVKTVLSVEEGKALVNEGEAAALISIGSEFTDSVASGGKGSIDVYINKYSSFKTSIVQTIVDSFIDSGNMVEAIVRLGGTVDYNLHHYGRESIENMGVAAEGRIPSAMDYYAVTMLVMILMYGANYGCHGMAEDYHERIGDRIKSTPIRMWEHFVGKTAGIVVTIMWQAVVLVLFTKYVYKANWGGDIPAILLICVSLSVCATALGIMACVLFKNRMNAAGFLMAVIPVCTMVAGGYAKFDNAGQFMQVLMRFSPNYHAQTAMFNTIYGGSLPQTVISIGVLWGAAAIMFVISVMAGRRYAK